MSDTKKNNDIEEEFIINNGYTPEEFYKIMNNYLTAIYRIKEATFSLKNNVNTRIETYSIQTDNAKEFSKIISQYNDYVNKLKIYIPYINFKQ